ncbi:MAG: hypothetical protein LQ352_002333 [Teloschistes flavicans]|nr:MAG: hypothetical protein LQ352_002333 [Teloschistes flavicans]
MEKENERLNDKIGELQEKIREHDDKKEIALRMLKEVEEDRETLKSQNDHLQIQSDTKFQHEIDSVKKEFQLEIDSVKEELQNYVKSTKSLKTPVSGLENTLRGLQRRHSEEIQEKHGQSTDTGRTWRAEQDNPSVGPGIPVKERSRYREEASSTETSNDEPSPGSDRSPINSTSHDVETNQSPSNIPSDTMENPVKDHPSTEDETSTGPQVSRLSQSHIIIQRHIEHIRRSIKSLEVEKEDLSKLADGSPGKRHDELMTALKEITDAKPQWLDDLSEQQRWCKLVDECCEAYKDEDAQLDKLKTTRTTSSDYPKEYQKYAKKHETTLNSLKAAKPVLDRVYEELPSLTKRLLRVSNSIQTHCRIRPRLDSAPITEIYVVDQNMVELDKPSKNPSKQDTGEKIQYRFDGITGRDKPQDELIGHTLALCQAVLEGTTVCIFCYGPTNSGKSYTMLGGRKEDGLILAALIELCTKIRAQKHEARLSVKGVEFYGNDINVDKNPTVIKDLLDASEYMNKQYPKKRHVSPTKRNKTSSRSHSGVIVTVPPHGTNDKESKMLLLDLAGTEPPNTGDKFENNNINRDLYALRRVFKALVERSKRPYKDRKVHLSPVTIDLALLTIG